MTLLPKIKEINPDFKVVIAAEPEVIFLNKEIEAEVDAIWKKELQFAPNLFNGLILNVISYDKEQLVGQFIEYKHFIAQNRQPQLKAQLKINTLGISGVTLAKDHVLLGKRAAHVSQYPGLYELAPSGGVDSDALSGDYVDYKLQISKELEEETGFLESQIESITPLFIVECQNTIEIVAEVRLKILELTEIVTAEYNKVFWMHKKNVSAFAAEHKNQLVPLSHFLMQQLF